ncbi:hypothetical protein FVE85_0926 [Porphyridium purpureum]|uniref:Survival Motor Neuron Gemin2-binding domain-containing protein n=1 Tax=Porphyridium purpureum TaxID=35688 RepID=A0A5J4Z3J6_PORPP|nr:hypothetical protein FVE85_0926 [Porphyridium purpureum]|eukprot:POR1128..scf208_2
MNEVWDDTELIEAWDHALASYASAADEQKRSRRADSDADARSEKQADKIRSTHPAAPETGRAEGASHQEAKTECGDDSPALLIPAPPPLNGITDYAQLHALLISWYQTGYQAGYSAGYYTGLHVAATAAEIPSTQTMTTAARKAPIEEQELTEDGRRDVETHEKEERFCE